MEEGSRPGRKLLGIFNIAVEFRGEVRRRRCWHWDMRDDYLALKITTCAQHAPGIPKVLVGNRLHLAFRRQVSPAEAEEYAEKNAMGFFEVSS